MRLPWQKRATTDDLYAAIADGSPKRVRDLLTAGADPNILEEAGDLTPLMSAAAAGRLDIVQLLVSAGADVNVTAEDLSGDLDKFRFLDGLFAQAKIRAMFPLAYAAVHDHQDTYDFLAPLTSPHLRRQADKIQMARQTNTNNQSLKSPSRAKNVDRAKPLKIKAGEDLLAQNPKLSRWINKCVLCGRKGYKPEMPEQIDKNGSADLLRGCFRPLPLVDHFCERCTEKSTRGLAAAHESQQRKLRKYAQRDKGK